MSDKPASTRSRIAAEDKVPLTQKAAYAAGGVINPFIDFSQSWMIMFFTQAFGISPAWITTAGGIFRAWDAINDPIIGSMSDNCRSRFGRRRPFIFVGAILFGLSMPLLWSMNPDWPETAKIIYMIVAGIILYTTASIWALPYQSLVVEMTPDSNERTRVLGLKTFFSYAAGLVNNWLPKLAALTFFAGPILPNGEPNLAEGLVNVSWVLCFLVIILGILPAIFCKERYFEGGITAQQERVPILKSFLMTIRCAPFLNLTLIMLTQAFGSMLVGSLGFFVARYYVCDGSFEQAATIWGVGGTIGLPVGILSIPFWTWFSEKFSKERAVSGVVIIAMCAKVLTWFLFTPENPWLMLIPLAFDAFHGAAMWMIIPSMLGDVIDHDELEGGNRREGNFSAVFLFCIKVGVTIAGMGTGFLLVYLGYNPDTAAQTPELAKGLINAYVFIPVGVWCITLLLTFLYPLNPQRIRETRTSLEARRGKV